MSTRHYTVARHTFAVTLPEGETGIALPSYEPFAVSCATDKLLFSLTVDDDFYPTERGETIGEFDCGAADFSVYRLPDGMICFVVFLLIFLQILAGESRWQSSTTFLMIFVREFLFC